MAVRSDGSDLGIGFQSAAEEGGREGGGTSILVWKVVPDNARPAMTVQISGSYSRPSRVSLAAFACHDKGLCTAQIVNEKTLTPHYVGVYIPVVWLSEF